MGAQGTLTGERCQIRTAFAASGAFGLRPAEPGQTVPVTPSDAIASAARRLRSDLERTGALSSATASVLDAALADRRIWVDAWPGGAEHVLGLVAQDVQETIHASIDDRWPRCPDHPDHPLFIEPDLGPDPFWVCHRSGLPVAQVGGL
jgi:hypothetical protein